MVRGVSRARELVLFVVFDEQFLGLWVGSTQGSSRLSVTDNFFDRYFESYISYPFPPCATGVPTIVRSGSDRGKEGKPTFRWNDNPNLFK